MSRLPDQLTQAVVFLYPTREDATSGARLGGTGFLVAVPCSEPLSGGHLYLVTASHVADSCSFARINDSSASVVIEMGMAGSPKVFSPWTHDPDGNDIAISRLNMFLPHGTCMVPSDSILTQEQYQSQSVGIGDETVAVGRFPYVPSVHSNRSVARFGRIAQAGTTPIPRKAGRSPQESIIVEAQSSASLSGSPVWVHRRLPPPATNLFQTSPSGEQVRIKPIELSLIGVNWGHLPELAEVYSARDAPDQVVGYGGNSGLMLVVPGWKILDLLSRDEFVEERKLAEAVETLGLAYDQRSSEKQDAAWAELMRLIRHPSQDGDGG